jgi:hypothetical protein
MGVLEDQITIGKRRNDPRKIPAGPAALGHPLDRSQDPSSGSNPK